MAFVEIFLPDTAGSPSAHSGSQSQCRIWFILPAHRASHLIRYPLALFPSGNYVLCPKRKDYLILRCSLSCILIPLVR